MCIRVLPACMSVQHLYDWFWQRPEEVIGSSDIGMTDVCE